MPRKKTEKKEAKLQEQVVAQAETQAETLPQPETKLVRRTLDDVWKHKYSKYKTSDPTVYKASLAKMNKIDLQRECLRVTLLPHDSRDIMGERLMKQFLTYQAGLKPVQRFRNGTGTTGGRAQDIMSRLAPKLA